jgi:TolB-like protein
VVALAVWGIVATGCMLFGDRASREEVDARKSIAVLPFDNLSPDPNDAYFTDGFHDEVLTHLQKIADLKVISRTSVMVYRDRDKNLRTIADELGVTHVLEGSVRRAGDQVRITTQLIEAEQDEHLLAENYQRELSDVFAVQADIAQRIASALKAQLTPEEGERIAARPTENLEAYEHHMRGRAYYRRGRAAGLGGKRWALEDSAISEYERAVELDPEFSAAWAALAVVATRMFFEATYTPLTEKREQGEQALARAVELAPQSFETQLAQAIYYSLVGEDKPRAMRHLKVAEALRPNDTEALSEIASVLMRQGKWEEALTYNERAVELDPQNAASVRKIAGVYRRMRRFDEAERYLDRAIALEPSAGGPPREKFDMYLYGLGDTVKARVLAEQHPARNLWQADLHYCRRDYDQAVDIRRSHFLGEWPLLLRALYLTGRSEETRAYADSIAREARREPPSDSRTTVQLSLRGALLGLAYAFAGDVDAAIREGEEALELYPVATDQYNYWIIVFHVCSVYVLAGEHDAAIDQLEILLSTPNPIGVGWLRLDPFYDPLRDHPRFQALLAEYE